MNAGQVIKLYVKRPILWLLDTLAWPCAVVAEAVLRGLLRLINLFKKD